MSMLLLLIVTLSISFIFHFVTSLSFRLRVSSIFHSSSSSSLTHFILMFISHRSSPLPHFFLIPISHRHEASPLFYYINTCTSFHILHLTISSYIALYLIDNHISLLFVYSTRTIKYTIWSSLALALSSSTIISTSRYHSNPRSCYSTSPIEPLSLFSNPRDYVPWHKVLNLKKQPSRIEDTIEVNITQVYWTHPSSSWGKNHHSRPRCWNDGH